MLRGKQDRTLYTLHVGDELLRAGRGQEGSTQGVRAAGFGGGTVPSSYSTREPPHSGARWGSQVSNICGNPKVEVEVRISL